MRETGIDYTLTNSAGTSITLKGTASASANVFLRKMNAIGGLRTAFTDRPQADGSYNETGYESGLSVEIECYVLGTSAASRQTLNDSVIQVLNGMKGGGGSLAWTAQGAATTRTLSLLSLAAPVSFELYGGTIKTFQALLKSEKPYCESTTATTVDSVALTSSGGGFIVPLTIPVTFTSSGGGTLTYTNSGSVPIRPVVRVYGPITSPVVSNTTTGERLTFTGTIAAGDYWEIDLFQRTVLLNGVSTATSPLRSLVPTSTTWFACAVGSTALQLTGAGYDANTLLRAYQKSAWS